MTFLYILLALVVLLVLITVHEFGHYCAGKILGFKINEFAIGFGPAIFKRVNKKTGEQFSIRILPLGGFCAFEGEDEAGNENPGSFNTMPAWKRLIVLLSGVGFNFLFGVLAAVIYLLVSGYATPIVSATIKPGSETTLQTNDVIMAVDGKKIEAYRSFNDLMAKYKEGQDVTLTVNRDGQIIEITTSKEKYDPFYFIANTSKFENKIFDENGVAIPMDKFINDIVRIETIDEEGESVGKGSSLVSHFSNVYKNAEKTEHYTAEDITALITDGTISYASSYANLGMVYSYTGQSYSFFEAIVKAWPFCFYLCGLILSSLAGLFTGATSVSDLGGTVTAISQIAQVSSWGIESFLLLLPLLAMNLALFNILPIPALDGAKCVFVAIEMIFRKPVNRKVEGWIHTIGLFVLLGLVIFLDIYHFAFASCLLLS